MKELQCHRVFETDFGIDVKMDPVEVSDVYFFFFFFFMFLLFDLYSNGVLDLEEVKLATKRIMLVVADGIGLSPLQMILDDDGFLMIFQFLLLSLFAIVSLPISFEIVSL